MAFCKNHPQVPAAGRCAGCAEEFCSNCLVDIQGQKYCGACKVMVLQGKTPTAVINYQEATGNLPNKLAKEALIYSLVGIVCCGIILEPFAIYKAIQAKKAIQEDPNLGGSGMATAALVIGIIGLVLNILGLALRAMAVAAH
jgi:hypothetical protein